jgi:hypothetical protein
MQLEEEWYWNKTKKLEQPELMQVVLLGLV